MASERPAPLLSGFERAAILRVLALAAVLVAIAWLFGATRFRVVPLLLVPVAAVQLAGLLRLQRRTGARLAGVLGAWSAGDLADGGRDPTAPRPDADPLGDALERIGARLRASQRDAAQRARYLTEVIDHAPVALLAVEGTSVELLNAAAHRLFGRSGRVDLDSLAGHGASFVRDLSETPVGERRLTRAVLGAPEGLGAPDELRALVLSVSAFATDGRLRRLVSLQDIQRELDGRALDAWQEMARVLAHEIMGSLTPVASLSATAAERLAEVDVRLLDSAGQAAVADAAQASAVAARRSDGLMRFVSRYREFASMPPPQRERVDVAELLTRMASLFAAELDGAGVALELEPLPAPLRLSADRSLLEQALINLVRNAAEAVRGRPGATIWLRARLTAAGRVALEVADNGDGVDPALAERIFVPFFTTRKAGTGIGLSLVRSIAQLHGGSVAVGRRSGGGASFTLTL